MKKFFKLDTSLSVVIPAYNEGEAFTNFIHETIRDARKITHDFEIIVVDDGSTDITGRIADALARRHRELQVIHHRQNQGLASAFRTGINACTKESILYIEGDGQQPLKDQHAVLAKLERADVVLGARSQRFDYSFFRKVLSYGFIFLLRLFFGLTFKDYGWSQAYRRKIFQTIKLKSPSPFFCAELVIKAKQHGYRIEDALVPYRSRKSGSTNYGNIRTAALMFWDMMRLRFGFLN